MFNEVIAPWPDASAVLHAFRIALYSVWLFAVTSAYYLFLRNGNWSTTESWSLLNRPKK
jgi:hypothetical protein